MERERRRPGPITGSAFRIEVKSATPNLTPRTKLRKQVALEGWLEATKEGFAQLYATVFVDGGYDDPQGIADCPPSEEELKALLSPHGAKKPHLVILAKAIVKLYLTLVVDTQFSPEQHSKLVAWLEGVKPGLEGSARFAVAFTEAGYNDESDFNSPRLPFEEIKQILAPVGGKGPHFHRIADAIRQGRGGIGSPSADLVEWLNGVSPTFGWLYSTAFALAGFESVIHVTELRPDIRELQEILKPAEPKLPHIKLIALALDRLSETHADAHPPRHDTHVVAAANLKTFAAESESAIAALTLVSASSLSPLPSQPPSSTSAAALLVAPIPVPAKPAPKAVLDNDIVPEGGGHEKDLLQTETHMQPRFAAGKHAFLSYQWDVQDKVLQIKTFLTERGIKCWMDIDGGMKSDIYDSMAEGVQNAAVVVCFMTKRYQESANCKLELQFAQQSGVPILPLMMTQDYTPSGWLGIITAGAIWIPLHDGASFLEGVGKLHSQLLRTAPQAAVAGSGGGKSNASASANTDQGGSDSKSNASDFDVATWGNDIFSFDETRDELERLRLAAQEDGSKSVFGSEHGSQTTLLCTLPALVPTIYPGITITPAMNDVLSAVLSATTPQQIGFCGMGGIGKTTVSAWVVRQESVRKRFDTIAWISFGQTPDIEASLNLLYLQLMGMNFGSDISFEQKVEGLKQAFVNRSILAVLDDVWDPDVAKQFNLVDETSINSKLLISSRVRSVLDGGLIIDIPLPTKEGAARMLLSAAGMCEAGAEVLPGDLSVGEKRTKAVTLSEAIRVSEVCKRLPLTVGIAAKLIREMTAGDDGDCSDVVDLLQEEMEQAKDSSVEEGVIRASIKSIPAAIRRHVVQLFHAFSLIPEDCNIPLDVLGMLFDANHPPDANSTLADDSTGSRSSRNSNPAGATAAGSRLKIRRCLKVLLDRSLILGTVDAPQVHDIVWEYVKKQLTPEEFAGAQRRLVDAFRASDRSVQHALGKYIQNNVKHHVQMSFDEEWSRSKQAESWLDDHLNGEQDAISTAAASILPAVKLAEQAEADKRFWTAALRWNACANVGFQCRGTLGGHDMDYLFRAATNARQIQPGVGQDINCNEYSRDAFMLINLTRLVMQWKPGFIDENPWIPAALGKLMETDAANDNPLYVANAMYTTVFMDASISGNGKLLGEAALQLWKFITKSIQSERFSHETRSLLSTMSCAKVFMAGEYAAVHVPGFDWDELGGSQGHTFVATLDAYNFDNHHAAAGKMYTYDPMVCTLSYDWILLMHYGDATCAMRYIDKRVGWTKKLKAVKTVSISHVFDCMLTFGCLPNMNHILNRPDATLATFALLGVTFDNAEAVLTELGDLSPIFSPMNCEEPGHGWFSLTRCVYNAKCFLILHGNVPKDKAVAFLKSLPKAEQLARQSVLCNEAGNISNDMGLFMSQVHQNWPLALACEKLGLFEETLHYAEYTLNTDVTTGGSEMHWPDVIAFACKGRTLAKHNDHVGANAAFCAGVEAAKASKFHLMEALALRELALHDHDNYTESARQARLDLGAKLKIFDGRMTLQELGSLKLGLI